MSEISAATVSEWLKNYSAVISEHANELTDLDRQIGDAELGAMIARGMTSVAGREPQPVGGGSGGLKKAAISYTQVTLASKREEMISVDGVSIK